MSALPADESQWRFLSRAYVDPVAKKHFFQHIAEAPMAQEDEVPETAFKGTAELDPIVSELGLNVTCQYGTIRHFINNTWVHVRMGVRLQYSGVVDETYLQDSRRLAAVLDRCPRLEGLLQGMMEEALDFAGNNVSLILSSSALNHILVGENKIFSLYGEVFRHSIFGVRNLHEWIPTIMLDVVDRADKYKSAFTIQEAVCRAWGLDKGAQVAWHDFSVQIAKKKRDMFLMFMLGLKNSDGRTNTARHRDIPEEIATHILLLAIHKVVEAQELEAFLL